MAQKVVTNATRTLFYCWLQDRWYRLCKLSGHQGCFNRGCRGMLVPKGPHLRKAGLV